MSAARAEDVKRITQGTERTGGRLAMRITGTGNHVCVTGGAAYRRAFQRGYALGEVIALLSPWHRVGSGAVQ